MSNWALVTYCFVSFATIAYVVFFIVITIGGFFDLMYLLKSLKTEIVDATDDGRAKKSDLNPPDESD
jgi:hypothetical protein